MAVSLVLSYIYHWFIIYPLDTVQLRDSHVYSISLFNPPSLEKELGRLRNKESRYACVNLEYVPEQNKPEPVVRYECEVN